MSVLSTTAQTQVEDKLVEDKILSRADLSQLKTESKEMGTPIFGLLVSSGKVSNEQLTKTIAHVTRVPYVNLVDAKIDPKILALLPEDVAERYMAVPLGEMQHRLVVAMLDADNVQAVDYLSNRIGRPLKVYAASEEGIRQVLHQYQTKLSDTLVNEISGMTGEVTVDQTKKQQEEAQKAADRAVDIGNIVQDSPISKALNTILEYAAKNRASDIHIEPLKDGLKIRCRVDGILREIMKLPKSTEPPLISRIKILSNLKIDEHRVPQDGEFTVIVGGKDIDLRISISPVIWGEQVVIRLLDKSGTSLKLEDMGYVGRNLRTIRSGLERTNGMILTSGPTGSGKSTTLAALVDKINSERASHIITVEDPIEYTHKSKRSLVVQREVHYDTFSFAAALRSALREDPDVVLIGEMRDLETIEAALRIAETGHLTFATLHTNSAAQTINRIIDVFPAHQQGQIRTQLSLVLEGIVCQTLLRKANGPGRTVALEIMVPTPAIRNLIREDKIHQIYSAMQTGQEKLGMQTLNQCLTTLYLSKQITMETALTASSNKDELQEMINRGVGVVAGAGMGRGPAVARPVARS